jgi:hypothetical protein
MFCRLFRFMISSAADSGNAVDRWTSRHIAHCVSCRQFLQSCRTIDVRLRSEAAAWRQGSGQLSRRIPPNLSDIQPPSHGSRIRVALAAAACLVIAWAAVLLFSTPTKPPAPPTAMTGAIIPTGTQWATKWAELIQNPLAAEAKHLTSDTESGVRFLVACLDVRPLGANMAPPPGESGPPPLH